MLVVQEPPPKYLAELGRTSYSAFAQPMVFFSFSSLTSLALSSGVGRNLRSLRFRIPSRLYARDLAPRPGALPNVRYLDVSTSVIGESEVKVILQALPDLEHLVVDFAGLCGYGSIRNGWYDLGKICATAGIETARARERAINQQLLSDRRQQQLQVDHTNPRGPSIPADGGLLDGSGHSGADAWSATCRAVRILSRSPKLLSICAATSPDEPQPTAENCAEWVHEFGEGWAEGMARLKEHWHRAVAIAMAGSSTALLTFAGAEHPADKAGQGDTIFAGLIGVEREVVEMLMEGSWQTPGLCFSMDPQRN